MKVEKRVVDLDRQSSEKSPASEKSIDLARSPIGDLIEAQKNLISQFDLILIICGQDKAFYKPSKKEIDRLNFLFLKAVSDVREKCDPHFVDRIEKIVYDTGIFIHFFEKITTYYLGSGKEKLPSVFARWQMVDDYAARNPGSPVAEYVQALFPELAEIGLGPTEDYESDYRNYRAERAQFTPPLSLPEQAPEIYSGLRGPETPPEFVQRVYGQWLGQGLTRAHIRKLDPVLYTAIDNWLKKPGTEWPADVDLPTKAEQITRDLEALQAAAGSSSGGVIRGEFTLKEAARLQAAQRRREK